MAEICPVCNIGTLYVVISNKDGSIKLVKCKSCKKNYDYKKLQEKRRRINNE